MKSVTFEQSSPNVWEEKKKRSHLLFLPWSRLPPTPSLETLSQIAFTQAFITQLKLSYWSWHSERATTSAKQFILAFSSRRIYGKVSNSSTNGHVLFECGQQVAHSSYWHVDGCNFSPYFQQLRKNLQESSTDFIGYLQEYQIMQNKLCIIFLEIKTTTFDFYFKTWTTTKICTFKSMKSFKSVGWELAQSPMHT